MRILYQLNQLGYGGTERVVLTLARHGLEHGHEVAIFLNSDFQSSAYYRRKLWSLLDSKAAKRFHLKYVQSLARKQEALALVGKSLFIGHGLPNFEKSIRNFRPDIVHVNRGLEKDFYTESVWMQPKPKILETNIFGNSSNKAYLDQVDEIIFISHWLRSKSPWADAHKTKVIYNPVAEPIKSEGISLRKQLGISSQAIVLGRLCRPDLDDGSLVLDIVKRLQNKYNLLHFVWLGAPSELLKNFARNTEQIHLLPASSNAEDLERFYGSLDILLHYRIEGETFGMVVAEAMIRGLPVVSHRSTLDNAQAELLLSNGPAGVIIDYPTPENFCDAISALIENPTRRDQLGKEGKRVAKEHFSENIASTTYFQCYEEILS